MNSTAYKRKPLAQPIDAASATNCQVSNDLSASINLPPRLRPHWPIRPRRCPREGRNSRLGTARRRSLRFLLRLRRRPWRGAFGEKRRDTVTSLLRRTNGGDVLGGT